MAPNNDEVRFIAASLRNLDRLAEAFERMLPTLATLAMALEIDQERLSAIPDWLDRIDNRLEKIERAIILVNSDQRKQRVKTITQELRSEMFDGLMESLKERLKINIRHKNKLLEDSATYGADTPFHVTEGIIRVNAEIDKIRCEIEALQEVE